MPPYRFGKTHSGPTEGSIKPGMDSVLLATGVLHPISSDTRHSQLSKILNCVHVIHEAKIIHSDLKPANFVLVKGQLKLIDFGIANAIANDTTNIQRDHQVCLIAQAELTLA